MTYTNRRIRETTLKWLKIIKSLDQHKTLSDTIDALIKERLLKDGDLMLSLKFEEERRKKDENIDLEKVNSMGLKKEI